MTQLEDVLEFDEKAKYADKDVFIKDFEGFPDCVTNENGGQTTSSNDEVDTTYDLHPSCTSQHSNGFSNNAFVHKHKLEMFDETDSPQHISSLNLQEFEENVKDTEQFILEDMLLKLKVFVNPFLTSENSEQAVHLLDISQNGNDYGNRYGNDFGNRYGIDFGNRHGIDFNFGNRYGNDFGNDYGNKYGNDFCIRYGNDYGIKYGNDFDFGNRYGSDFGIRCGDNFSIRYCSYFGIRYCSYFGIRCDNDFGNSFGIDFGNRYGSEFDIRYGQDFGNRFGNDFGSRYGNDSGNNNDNDFGSRFGKDFIRGDIHKEAEPGQASSSRWYSQRNNIVLFLLLSIVLQGVTSQSVDVQVQINKSALLECDLDISFNQKEINAHVDHCPFNTTICDPVIVLKLEGNNFIQTSNRFDYQLVNSTAERLFVLIPSVRPEHAGRYRFTILGGPSSTPCSLTIIEEEKTLPRKMNKEAVSTKVYVGEFAFIIYLPVFIIMIFVLYKTLQINSKSAPHPSIETSSVNATVVNTTKGLQEESDAKDPLIGGITENENGHTQSDEKENNSLTHSLNRNK